jgi:hypothetical protein
MARYFAACDGRSHLRFDDAARAVGIMDRAATRLPALGTVTERTRIGFLMIDDGLPRLAHTFSMTEEST